MKAGGGKRGCDLYALRVFLAVEATGSMTAAARKLGLTQSAISQAIRQLEEFLGSVLVDRAQRPLALTAAGAVLRRRARSVIEDAEALETAVRHASSAKVPELRLGVIDSFASTVGPGLIAALLRTTATHLSFQSGLAHDQAEGLLNRSLDFIITSDALDDVDGLDRYPILSEPFILLLPEKVEAASDFDLRQLAVRHSLIRFSARSQIGVQIERYLRQMGVRAPQLLEVDATDSLVAMVAAGLGWAIATPLCLLQVHADPKRVRPLPIPVTGFTRQLHLIVRSSGYGELPQRVAEVACDILRKECMPALRRLMPWLKDQLVIGRGGN